MSTLSEDEITRYARHIILPEVGPKGQEALKAGSVLVVGAGGLGSPLAMYLAAAGVGRIGIIDFDVVDASNLQRQILHGTASIGKTKLDSAVERLKDINPHVEIEAIPDRLSSENAIELFKQYDVIADGTDNFPTRYLVNDACVLSGKPNVYASIFRFEGQVSVFNYEGGPCYRCLYSEPPPPGLVPSCAEGGVLGVLCGVVGSLQATEVVKVLTGIGESAAGRLIMYDALKLKFRELKLRKDPNCVICSDNATITAPIDYELFCGIRKPETPAIPQTDSETVREISPVELKQKIDANESFTLIDVREPHELDICEIDGAVHIPLGQFEHSLSELKSEDQYVIMCRSGRRSATAVQMMQENGFTDALNLEGGILKWADDVDPSLTKY